MPPRLRGALVVGQFGRTLLVRLRDSNVAFALKQMKKGALLAASALPHALNERAVLQRCGAHPFLPRCAAACQDAAHLYLATDYCAGGTLGAGFVAAGLPIGDAATDTRDLVVADYDPNGQPDLLRAHDSRAAHVFVAHTVPV